MSREGAIGLIIIGPPTSGKTAQAEEFANTLPGQLVRGSGVVPELVREHRDNRKLIPDEKYLPALSRLLDDIGKTNVVFENIPRTREQARLLVEWARSAGTSLHVVVLDIPEEEVVERATQRLECECGATYNPIVKPSKVPGICDRDGKKLYIREGDKEEVVRRGYRNYRRLESELLPELGGGATIHKVSAEGPVEDVSVRIKEELRGI